MIAFLVSTVQRVRVLPTSDSGLKSTLKQVERIESELILWIVGMDHRKSMAALSPLQHGTAFCLRQARHHALGCQWVFKKSVAGTIV